MFPARCRVQNCWQLQPEADVSEWVTQSIIPTQLKLLPSRKREGEMNAADLLVQCRTTDRSIARHDEIVQIGP